jgi:hypothetical protein
MKVRKNREPVELEALLDSRAGGLFINTTFTKENEFTLCNLPEPLNAYNVDGTLNKKEPSRHISKQIFKSENRSQRHGFTSLD